jgi:hypothetical protein
MQKFTCHFYHKIHIKMSQNPKSSLPSKQKSPKEIAKNQKFTKVISYNLDRFISKGPARRKSCQEVNFASYDMSKDELASLNNCPSNPSHPMRRVPSHQKCLLHNPTDKEATRHYLQARWEISPTQKYYFPEATSWRYGWNCETTNVRK